MNDDLSEKFRLHTGYIFSIYINVSNTIQYFISYPLAMYFLYMDEQVFPHEYRRALADPANKETEVEENTFIDDCVADVEITSGQPKVRFYSQMHQ